MTIKLIELNVKDEICNSITCKTVPTFDVNAVISEFIVDKLHGMVLNIKCKIVDLCEYEVVVKTTATN